jgi:phosphopantothenoylcysteine decarboxylase/phosphopantothenate--cysteine ligase
LRILLGITGGVAAFKAASILRLLTENGHDVRVVATENALRFIGETTLANLSKHKVNVDLYADTEEGAHIELADWAEKILIAPATASLLGRLANGIATDLLTNVVMATSAQITIAPAMHTNMFTNQATQSNIQKLRQQGIDVIEPAIGRLSGTDTGIGRLPEPEQIVERFLGSLPLAGIEACVTLGGTQEAIDSVRFIGNRSSGKQGMAFARALRDLGASVKLITANVSNTESFESVSGNSHQEMKSALEKTKCDLLVMSAAVSDFTVTEHSQKIDGSESVSLTLIPTEDLVSGFKKANPNTVVLGFSVADQHSDWLQIARDKKTAKGLDFLFANTVEAFGQDENVGVLIGENETELSGSKQVIARDVIAVIQRALLK